MARGQTGHRGRSAVRYVVAVVVEDIGRVTHQPQVVPDESVTDIHSNWLTVILTHVRYFLCVSVSLSVYLCVSVCRSLYS